MRIDREPPFPPPAAPPQDGEGGWRLVRLWLASTALGIALATLVTFALLWLDVGGLGGLIAQDGTLLPLLLLWGPLASLLGTVVFAARVMAIGSPNTP